MAFRNVIQAPHPGSLDSLIDQACRFLEDHADGRVTRLKHELRNTGATVSRAAVDAGFDSHSSAYDTADGHFGMTPATYAAGGTGATIRFAIGDSPFGKVLVAATQKGVCAVSLGSTPTALRQSLEQEYPNATIIEDEHGLADLCSVIIDNAVAGRDQRDVPTDVAGTAFQWKVWRALRAIPVGETRSYKNVAESIGRPTAVRAVARACATNNIALVIPCHRVVRSDRSTSGYRWGTDQKQLLLAHEAAVSIPARVLR